MPDDRGLPQATTAERTRRPLRRGWIVGGVVLAALVVLVLVWDWNWFKGPIERRVSERTGRAFVIGGDLDVDLRIPLRVHMHDVRFDNPPWAAHPQMLQLESADFSIRVLPALRGELVFPEVALTHPQIDLERTADGANNWTFGNADGAKGTAPVIGTLAVDQGLIRFADATTNSRVDTELSTTGDGLRAHATGTFRKNKIDVEGTGGGILSLEDASAAYPFDLHFRVGPTRGTAKGTITGLVALAAADFALDLQGESLDELFPLIHVSLPPSPPYRLKGRVVHEGDVWHMNDFTGGMGDSDLSGSAAVTPADARPEKRPLLQAHVQSKVLDLDDLGGVVGAPPQAGPGETASTRQARAAAAKKAAPRLLPDKKFDLTRLRAMDADVTFEGKSIRGRTPIDDMNVHFKIDGGVLTAEPLNFGVAGGNVTSQIKVDARGDTIDTDATIEIKRIDMHKLSPDSTMGKQSLGLIGGRAKLHGKGNSVAAMASHADGTMGFATARGTISNLLLELVGLDAAEALKRLFKGDKPVNINCGIADFDVRDGVMQTRTMVLDTADTNINIDGTINLRDESLDLTLHPLPHDWSPLSLRSPLHLVGSFKNPKVRPDAKLIERGAIAVVLGALLGPVAALVPLIETGPGDDVDCEALIASVRQHAGATPPR